ncbi:methyltransferase domain-containing protein [Methylobacterium trifolii]|uniref:Ubiquinone biosynthesis O-methyltransferase, mitochondrial n=1 Tax=Methylobacterium trifolii TaxID=1003092 RepID=A0ABQ4U2H0_9HYPH|nr:methyltransferase domain-containing protein [Methylobacterium trifolii]GJE61337.1 Ubiquinone biosynthesis O-methyltransferase, mitochondrial [Methylobacterium trifolii]
MSESYYKNVNPDLLGWLPLTARRVLEIGCGEGALAAVYAERNPNAHYTAVEVHPPSAAVARGRVDRLIEGDIEAMSDAEAGGPFDLALMGDVLEHLAEPGRMLTRIFDLLEPGGHFVACVPNIAHWSALRELMSGRWPAHDSGLFDRTHLRFFTRDSLQEALTATGFRILKMRPRRFLLDQAEAARWMPVLGAAAARMGLDRAAFEERASAVQYVVCAEKPRPDRPRTEVLVVHQMAMAPRLLEARAAWPAKALDSEPGLSLKYDERKIEVGKLPPRQPKVAVIQRFTASDPAQWFQAMARFVAGGWVVAMEFDDHPELVAEVLRRDYDAGTQVSFSAAHAIQTSTPELAAYFRSLNPEVAVFPNAAFTLPPFPEARTGPPTVFFGALNREGFSGPVARALAPAIAQHPETTFTVVHDRAFFDALPTERKTFHPAMGYEAYLEAMAGADIALMPLEGRPPERFKSDIKFVEASSRGLATIASPTVYGQSIRDDHDGLIAATIEDWPRHLTRLLADPGERRRLARNAWEGVRADRMFAQQAGTRRDWYRSLWDRRDALNEALFARHPEIRLLVAAIRDAGRPPPG